jgi:hypothetical protein
MNSFHAEKIALLDAIKAELPAGIECTNVVNTAFDAVETSCHDGSATLRLSINSLGTRLEKCRLSCFLSAKGLVSREFKQAQARSVLKPKAIAQAIVAMLKLSFEVETAKATMLSTALDAVRAAAPDAPVQQHRDAFSASIYGDLMVVAVELRGEEVILTVRDRSRSYSDDTLSVTPEQDFDAEKFSKYIEELVWIKRTEYLKQQSSIASKELSRALARQLNDEFPLCCIISTDDPNKVNVDPGRSMTAEQARKLGVFLDTLLGD